MQMEWLKIESTLILKEKRGGCANSSKELCISSIYTWSLHLLTWWSINIMQTRWSWEYSTNNPKLQHGSILHSDSADDSSWRTYVIWSSPSLTSPMPNMQFGRLLSFPCCFCHSAEFEMEVGDADVERMLSLSLSLPKTPSTVSSSPKVSTILK